MNGVVKIDLDKIQTIEEVKAMLKIILMASAKWNGVNDLMISTEVVNTMPIINNLVKDYP